MITPGGEALRIGNRYRLEEQIGIGAMGVVWRGTDELLNRPVAVKELLTVTSTNPAEVEESRQRLQREGRIGARLQHAHVISMFDVVIHEDRPWLVMEYLPSDSLATVVRAKGPLLPVQVAAIGRDVADGLAAAHAAGVVHRDVKPGNVLIGTDGRVKLTDFGVARAVDDVQLTRTGLIAGTPAFLAPEIAQGRTPTAASDVFALGATLYAAVGGRAAVRAGRQRLRVAAQGRHRGPEPAAARGPAHAGAHAAARGRSRPRARRRRKPATCSPRWRRGRPCRRCPRTPPSSARWPPRARRRDPTWCRRSSSRPPRRDGGRRCCSVPRSHSWPSVAARPRSRSPVVRRYARSRSADHRGGAHRGGTADGERRRSDHGRAHLGRGRDRPDHVRPELLRAAARQPRSGLRAAFPERTARSRVATTPSCGSTQACPR